MPRYNAILEFMNFALLMITFCLCLACQFLLSFMLNSKITNPSKKDQTLDALGPYEIVFMVFAAGFVLNEYSQAMENGWTIYVANVRQFRLSPLMTH